MNDKTFKCALVFAGVEKTKAARFAGTLVLTMALFAAPAQATDLGVSLGGINASVGIGGSGVSASVGVGNTVNAEVGVGLGGAGVGVGVDVSLGLGHGVTTPGENPVPGADIGNPNRPRLVVAAMNCATGGNTEAFNGMTVVDRGGQAIGLVHDASITAGESISSIGMQTLKNTCISLQGGTYKVKGQHLWVNIDGGKFR